MHFAQAAGISTDDQVRNAISGFTVQHVFDIFDAASKWVVVFGLMIAVLAIMIGAYFLVSSKGDSARVERGKKTIWWAAAGTAILIISRSIFAIFSNFLGAK
jgi:hypothetical protein